MNIAATPAKAPKTAPVLTFIDPTAAPVEVGLLLELELDVLMEYGSDPLSVVVAGKELRVSGALLIVGRALVLGVSTDIEAVERRVEDGVEGRVEDGIERRVDDGAETRVEGAVLAVILDAVESNVAEEPLEVERDNTEEEEEALELELSNEDDRTLIYTQIGSGGQLF